MIKVSVCTIEKNHVLMRDDVWMWMWMWMFGVWWCGKVQWLDTIQLLKTIEIVIETRQVLLSQDIHAEHKLNSKLIWTKRHSFYSMSLRLSLNDWFAKYFEWHWMERSNASRCSLTAQHSTAHLLYSLKSLNRPPRNTHTSPTNVHKLLPHQDSRVGLEKVSVEMMA